MKERQIKMQTEYIDYLSKIAVSGCPFENKVMDHKNDNEMPIGQLVRPQRNSQKEYLSGLGQAELVEKKGVSCDRGFLSESV